MPLFPFINWLLNMYCRQPLACEQRDGLRLTAVLKPCNVDPCSHNARRIILYSASTAAARYIRPKFLLSCGHLEFGQCWSSQEWSAVKNCYVPFDTLAPRTEHGVISLNVESSRQFRCHASLPLVTSPETTALYNIQSHPAALLVIMCSSISVMSCCRSC